MNRLTGLWSLTHSTIIKHNSNNNNNDTNTNNKSDNNKNSDNIHNNSNSKKKKKKILLLSFYWFTSPFPFLKFSYTFKASLVDIYHCNASTLILFSLVQFKRNPQRKRFLMIWQSHKRNQRRLRNKAVWVLRVERTRGRIKLLLGFME